MTFPVMAQLVPRGDGSYLLKPTLTSGDVVDQWISVKKTAELLSFRSRNTVCKRIDQGLLVHKRMGERIVLVSLRSVMDLKAACCDDEFFFDEVKLKALQRRVEERMSALRKAAAEVLQGNGK